VVLLLQGCFPLPLRPEKKMIKAADFLKLVSQRASIQVVEKALEGGEKHLFLKGSVGSGVSLLLSLWFERAGKQQHLVVMPDKEQAAYFYNDLENLLQDAGRDYEKKRVLFYPTAYKRPYEPEKLDKAYELSRTEVLKRFLTEERKTIVVTYPEALSEKVVTRKFLNSNMMKIHVGDELSLDFLIDVLHEYGFEMVDFVAEPGEFSVRGGICDIFSFSNDHPYRLEFFGDRIESIRTFNAGDQLSVKTLKSIVLLPDVQDRKAEEERITFADYIPEKTWWWLSDIEDIHGKMVNTHELALNIFSKMEAGAALDPASLFATGRQWLEQLERFRTIEFATASYFPEAVEILFHQSPQPVFNKNFEFLLKHLQEKKKEGYSNFIFSSNPAQVKRLDAIFQDISQQEDAGESPLFRAVGIGLSNGFADNDAKIVCYTDHQIFERYHKFKLRESFGRKESISLKELYDLKPGDFVTHIDHGVGKYDGLQVIDNNGRKQEVIRLLYKNNDILYVSIHSLHRISKFVGSEGKAPVLNKLGSGAWNKLKSKTKKKVQDIARDLIKLYAERKAAKGFSFTPDTYLQNELEASFIYEDTPDQLKVTVDVKKDMEAPYPMDRLVCGDVGFGKTEIAIRAAFKAVADSKQVAILVPTTVLALQHAKTFSERLKDFPVTIDFLNRFKSAGQQRATLENLSAGKIDIIIGTHRLLSKDIEFKDLGLFIIDEEQKFGVAAKEKIRRLKVHVDTLILTATPIPRTLQFSLMGARDLSIINTPPPNRFPVQTELRSFHTQAIKEAVQYEVSRGGQVFFVHNRVQNILEVHDLLKKLMPKISIAVAHGQMEGHKLEKVMLDFINGYYDVLLSTNIIESGLDISNANTIIINQAQNFGLSDLHQLRGRVGRSNKKAFCYLLTPPVSSLPEDARKRLKAITEYDDLGSGFNIAMRDLDIRGAGNILGAEQSGFISEMGIEMYQNILNEALEELKQNEFQSLFSDEKKPVLTKSCQIETDMEILIPDFYVTSTAERLSLYKELDGIKTEEELHKFTGKLQDMFGPLPEQTKAMADTIKLRWAAESLGIEKVVLKNSRLAAYFIHNPESPFYQSPVFGQVLEILKQNPTCCELKEKNDKLSLVFHSVHTVGKALDLLTDFSAKVSSGISPEEDGEK